jgi:chromosome condensin MukBEF ATPase and DNA-binding subunit MukB
MLLSASEYYSKAEPYHFYTLQSNVQGLVVQADEEKEGRVLKKGAFVIIDDELDQKELKLLKQKKKNLEKSLKLNQRMAHNLARMIEKKNINYGTIMQNVEWIIIQI